jgi:hypothetical protein
VKKVNQLESEVLAIDGGLIDLEFVEEDFPQGLKPAHILLLVRHD